jgi:hypothetical protein
MLLDVQTVMLEMKDMPMNERLHEYRLRKSVKNFRNSEFHNLQKTFLSVTTNNT